MRRFLCSLAVLVLVFSCLEVPRNLVAADAGARQAAAPSFDLEGTRASARVALDRGELPAAWRGVRAWTEARPDDPAARLTEAQLYLNLNAPAAAINAAGRGLSALGRTTRELEWPLLAFKAQAHLAVGEPAAAWAAFSRIVQAAPASALNTPLIATARRARWEAFTAFTGEETFNHLEDGAVAVATPDAPVAAHLRLAQWRASRGDSDRSITELRAALAKHQESSELKAALAQQILFTASLADNGAQLGDLFERTHEDLAKLRAGPSVAALELEFLAYLQEKINPPEAPKRTEPRDFPVLVKNLTGTLAQRRAQLVAQLKQTTPALSAADAQVFDWKPEALTATRAALAAWEVKTFAAVRAVRAADAELAKLEATVEFLRERLEARIDDPVGGATAADRAALVELKARADIPDAQSEAVVAVREALDKLVGTAGALPRSRQRAEATALLAAAKTPEQRLAATEALIATGDISDAVWHQRAQAALDFGDPVEALMTGARAFVGEWTQPDTAPDRVLPAETEDLLTKLEKISAEVPELITQATAAWESGNIEQAFAGLDRVLALDPAQPTAWRYRWQWCEASGDMAAAVVALDHWWRLDDRAKYDAPTVFSLAAKGGAWELLLSLAEARIATEPTDTEAHLFRTYAAIACDRLELAKESLPILEVSMQRDQEKVIELLWSVIAQPDDPKVNVSYAVTDLLAQSQPPAGLAELKAYVDRVARGDTPVKSEPPVDLAAHPVLIHRARLEGRIVPVDYLARTRGTAEEPMAQFVTWLIVRQAGPSEEAQTLAARCAAETRLPLALRAGAHRLWVRDTQQPVVPAFRASDPFYSFSVQSNADWWGAPGQEIVITKNIYADAMPPEMPVRVRGIAGTAAQVTLCSPREGSEPGTRLWELRSTAVTGPFYQNATAVKSLAVLEGSNLVVDKNAKLAIRGLARFIGGRTDWPAITVEPGAQLEMRNVQGAVSSLGVSGTWTASDSELEFNQPVKLAGGARALMQHTRLTGPLPFIVETGAQATWREVLAVSWRDWPTTLPVGWVIDGARIATPVKGATEAIVPLMAPYRGELNVVASVYAEPTRRVPTIAELEAALATAKPGEVIELAAGQHTLAGPLRLPAGVSVVAARGAKVTVPRGGQGAFVASQPGAVRIRDFDTEVQVLTTVYANTTVQLEDQQAKTAVWAAPKAWVMVQGGNFHGWNHRAHEIAHVAAGARVEIFGQNITDKTTVEPGGVLMLKPPAYDTPPYDPLAQLRTAVALRTRQELWRDAGRRFMRAFDAAKTRDERMAAARTMGEAVGQTGDLTAATPPESTAAMMEIIVPALLRSPTESPFIYTAVDHYHVTNNEVAKKMMPASLAPYFSKFVASYDEHRAYNNDKVSWDTAYNFMLAYPPGSAAYAASREAMGRGLSAAEFEKEQEAKRKFTQELAAAAAKRNAEAAKQLAESEKRAKALAARPSSSGSGYMPRASTSQSTPTKWVEWTPSPTYQMKMYGRHLDIVIARAVRGY